MNRLRALWDLLTYWPVACDGCAGTGICTGENATVPHSCCGDCDRIVVPARRVPSNFMGLMRNGSTAMVGTGVMWRRPWSRRQIKHPRL